jgi:hypothetical protein
MQNKLKTIFLAITLLATVLTLFAAEQRQPVGMPAAPSGFQFDGWQSGILSISPKITEPQVSDTSTHLINTNVQR